MPPHDTLTPSKSACEAINPHGDPAVPICGLGAKMETSERPMVAKAGAPSYNPVSSMSRHAAARSLDGRLLSVELPFRIQEAP